MSNFMNKFTRDTRESIKNAREVAMQYNHSSISTVHLFLGILAQRENFTCEMLEYEGFDVLDIFEKVKKTLIPDKPELQATEIIFTSTTKKVLEQAELEMLEFEMDLIDTPHIMLGILKGDASSDIIQLLQHTSITYDTFKKILNDYVKEQREVHNDHGYDNTKGDTGDFSTPEAPFNNKSKTKKNPFLELYGRNLTRLAEEGKIDPVIGRDKEVKRLCQILARKKKSNAILVGGSGVGKTAVVEGFANDIAIGNVPDKMKNKQIYLLDVAGMISGSKYRGEFEKKLKTVMDECRVDKNIILFIDEIHTIIGAGGSEGAMDGANILKPALSNGELQVIGATTSEEYQKYFEKDNALVRRFQKLLVEQPDKQTTIDILYGLKKSYEQFHKVTYSKAIIELIVDLSSRYMPSQLEPDRSINILDEIGSKLSLEQQCPELVELNDEFSTLLDKKTEAIEKQDFISADKIKKELDQLAKKIVATKKQYEKNNTEVKEETVREVFSLISNIPVENVTKDEAKRYLSMASELKTVIINQDSAIDTIASVIKRKKSGIEKSNKPSVLFFAGPTGTGKTFTAKQMAKFMFNDETKLVFLNGAEYADKTALNRITGGNPGYVGYGEATDLEPIRNNPYSIILIDECEKMNRDIWQIFLRVFEEGQLKTANGKLIDFKNCIFILTSNLGSEASKRNYLGFDSNDVVMNQEQKQKRYEKEIKDYFKPEVYNRLSKVVIFNDLTTSDLKNILNLELKPLIASLAEKKIKLTFTEKAKAFILDHNEDKKGQYGARPIKRTIEQFVNDALSDILLEKEGDIKTIKVDATTDNLKFVST